MRKTLSSNGRNTKQFRSRGIASAVLCASLMTGLTWVGPTAAIAQAASSDIQPPASMRTASPLSAPSAQPAGIPLGSTELATPGISQPAPSLGAGPESCSGTDATQSSGAPFDGGGISGSTSLSCADGRPDSSPLLSSSSFGRVGIPLGATELGGAGISPPAPLASPTPLGSAGQANSTSTIVNPGNP